MLYFIVNKKSGSGKGEKIWQEVFEVLEEKNIEYKAWVTEYEGHANLLTKKICEQKDQTICLIVIGGDGTANEVINGISHFERVYFGMIPTGSGNDLARGLALKGSPSENLERILDSMKKGTEGVFRIDLGQVSWNGGKEPRLFAISSGVGLDALVCKKVLTSGVKRFLNRIHMGKLTYVFLTVPSLVLMQTADAAVYFNKKGQRNIKKLICVAAMNFETEGGGVPMAPMADAADGRLSVCHISRIPKWMTFFCLPFLMAAKHMWIKGFDVTDCRYCDLKLKRPMSLHADGEYCGEVTEVHFKCLPRKLRVLK